MGKRSKLLKGGLCKKNYQLVLKAKKDKEKNLLNNTIAVVKDYTKNEMIDSDDDANVGGNLHKNNNLNLTVYDEGAVNKHNSILGIDPEKLKSFLENPIKNRRKVNPISTLSRRQRRKVEKRERAKRIHALEDKIKLNHSMACGGLNSSKLMNSTLIPDKNKGNTTQNANFNLFDIDATLTSLFKDIGNNNKVPQKHSEGNNSLNPLLNNVPIKRTKRGDNKKLLNEEREKIKKVMENKNFQSNPIEAMKLHIKTTQMINERNRKIEENFEKNYNMLGLNKIK
jgi:hypothetical protein